MKNKLIYFLALPALLFTSNTMFGDDTEIYLNTNSELAGDPLVLLTLDYRPNLTARVCSGYNQNDPQSECWNMFWKCTEYQKNVNGNLVLDDNGNKICLTGTPWLPNPEDVSVPVIPVDPDAVNFFEIFVAALNVVFENLLEEKGEGAFRLGMMMNNNDNTTGQCGAGQGLAGRPDEQKCSNGGFVFLGFNDFTYEYKTQFIVKMLGLLPVLPQGNVSHSFQGAELYMELFRYLTGQDVLNGHNGYDNYNSKDDSDAPSNVGYTLGFTGEGANGIPRIIIPDNDDADSTPFENPQIGWDATIETSYATSATTSSYVPSISVAGLTPIGLSDVDNDESTSLMIDYPVPDAPDNNSLYRYISPLLEDCSRVYVLNFMFAVANQENDSDNFIEAPVSEQGLNITVSSNNAFTDVIAALNTFDLADGTWGPDNPDLDSKQNVKSFFYIDESQYQQALSKGYAQAGGTVVPRKITSDPEKLVTDIGNDLSAILSISTSFVSATVPVNVFNRSESLNNVFFGVFEAEESEQWPGNIKRLQLYVDPNDDTETLQVVDANGVEAISTASDSGRISNSALTFWTDPGGADVVGFDPDKEEISGFDGRSVDRGGAGQRLPGFLTDNPSEVNGLGRTLYTVSSTITSGSLIDFDADLGIAAPSTAEKIWNDLCRSIQGETCGNWSGGAPTDADTVDSNTIINDPATNDQEAANNLIKFARGVDIYDHDGDGLINDARPWLFGDILHSQPTPVNYGAIGGGYDEDNPDLRIIVASNDGYVRMIRNSDPNLTVQDPVEVDENGDALIVPKPDGSEDWAFMIPEFLPKLGYLANNDGTTDHPYGPDSSVTLYTVDNNNDGTLDHDDGDKAYIYFGLRRGGKAYYALDISDPDNPELLWKIAKSDTQNNNEADDFYEMGQTWSRPRVRTLDWGDGPKPAVIFAGGYDTKKDDDSNIVNGYDYIDDLNNNGDFTDDVESNADYADTEGNAIFIVDALTGELVWKASQLDTNDKAFTHDDLKDSIPSDTTPLDSNDDGIVDRVYVGDTGGVVWRVDLFGTDPDEWQITPVLNVGRHALGEPDRRFFHRPDVVPSLDELLENEPFDGILIGSGNRPNPRQVFDNNEYDQFYMLKDKDTAINPIPSVIDVDDAVTPGDMADLTAATAADLDLTADCNDPTTDCGKFSKGWYISFLEEGEKLLASSLTFFGKTFFSTYIPSGGDDSATCAPPEGVASTYAISLQDASPLDQYGFAGTTLAEQRSTITGHGIPSSPVIIGLGGNIYITPGNIGPNAAFRKKVADNPLRKTFWYEQEK